MEAVPQYLAKLLARVRGSNAPGPYNDGDINSPDINTRGDVLVAQALPAKAELVRMGNSFITIGSAVAPVAALPTTTAHLSLWNGEAVNGGKAYVIDRIGCILAATAGAAIQIGPMACLLNKGQITNPAGSIAILSLRGRQGGYNGNGNAKASVTVTNDGWFVLGGSLVCANTSNAMLGIDIPVDGQIIVPPQGLFSLATLCNAAGTATAQPWIMWHEVVLQLP